MRLRLERQYPLPKDCGHSSRGTGWVSDSDVGLEMASLLAFPRTMAEGFSAAVGRECPVLGGKWTFLEVELDKVW